MDSNTPHTSNYVVQKCHAMSCRFLGQVAQLLMGIPVKQMGYSEGSADYLKSQPSSQILSMSCRCTLGMPASGAMSNPPSPPTERGLYRT